MMAGDLVSGGLGKGNYNFNVIHNTETIESWEPQLEHSKSVGTLLAAKVAFYL